MTSKPLCRLCDLPITNKNRVKSHIVTRSTSIKPMLLPDGEQLEVVSSSGERVSFSGFGITEKNILCRDCDGRISLFENERLKLFNGFDAKILKGLEYVSVDGYDGDYIKLAYIADILRLSLSSGLLGKSVNVGDKHTDKMLDVIRNADASPAHNYMTIIGRFTGDFVPNLLMSPEKVRVNDLIYYRLIYPDGWCAMIKVDSRVDRTLSELALGSRVTILNFGSMLEGDLGAELIRMAHLNKIK